MKTLKTSKFLLLVFFSKFRNIPTKEFKNDDQMLLYRDIKEKLKDIFSKFNDVIQTRDDYITQLRSGQLEKAEAEKKLNETQKKISELENKYKAKKQEIKLEKSQFNFIFDYFSRKGKEIFNKVEDYLEFKEDLNDTNKNKNDK